MNELDLNKEIAEKLGFTEVKSFSIYPGKSEITVRGLHHDIWHVKDYCNNPADAWPIIQKYKISLQYEYMMGSWSADCVTHSILDDSPLKAAMLCFLEMEINDK